MHRHLLASTAALSGALLIAACAESPIAAPTGRSPGAARMSASSSTATHPSNTIKYSNHGTKPATGRSGSASMETRALINKDGSTTLDATTGSLEAGTTTGKFSKTQVKIIRQGTVVSTTNNNGLSSGTFSRQYTNALRNDVVQVQSNIYDVDPKRTDVVTLLTPAKLRPDLAVDAVTAPATAHPHQLVNISATVAEHNGDVGARANCVLKVNGAQVDIANGIWVDAGDVVNCAFTYTFDATGTYSVSVSLTNVNPGDWDVSNNSASTAVNVVNAGGSIPNGYIWIDRMNRSWTYDQSFPNSPYFFYQHEVGVEKWSLVYVQGWESAAQPRLDHAQVTVTSGATSFSHAVPMEYPYDYDDGYYHQHCNSHYDDGEWAGGCTEGVTGSWENTYYYYQHQSGVVTYTGQVNYCDWWGCDSYSYNNGWSYQGSVPLLLGNDVRVQASFFDISAGEHTLDLTATFQSHDADVNFSNGYCYTDYYYGYGCWSQVGTGTRAYGSALFP